MSIRSLDRVNRDDNGKTNRGARKVRLDVLNDHAMCIPWGIAMTWDAQFSTYKLFHHKSIMIHFSKSALLIGHLLMRSRDRKGCHVTNRLSTMSSLTSYFILNKIWHASVNHYTLLNGQWLIWLCDVLGPVSYCITALINSIHQKSSSMFNHFMSVL